MAKPKPKRILIVDDAFDLARLLQTALRTEHPGIDVALVMSAEEALLEASRGKLDLLVTDVRLPGMTGFDLVTKIRPRQPQMKIMIISGLTADDALLAQVQAAQADAFLHKPMEVAAFIERVNGLLGYENLPPLASTPPAVNLQPSALSDGGLIARLDTLRSVTGAATMVLLDATGKIVVQSGETSQPELLPLLVMPAIAASVAADRTATALGQSSPRAVQVFRGLTLDVAFAPIELHTLVVLLPTGPSALRLAVVLEEILAARDVLVTLVAALPPPVLDDVLSLEQHQPSMGDQLPPLSSAEEAQPSIPSEPEEQASPPPPEPDLEEFAAALSEGAAAPVELDLDAFWESADPIDHAPAKDQISFEQARKLGLVSDEGQN